MQRHNLEITFQALIKSHWDHFWRSQVTVKSLFEARDHLQSAFSGTKTLAQDHFGNPFAGPRSHKRQKENWFWWFGTRKNHINLSYWAHSLWNHFRHLNSLWNCFLRPSETPKHFEIILWGTKTLWTQFLRQQISLSTGFPFGARIHQSHYSQ